MKIIALSDLHGTLPQLEKCDVVIIAGDIVDLFCQYDRQMSWDWWTQNFLLWAKNLDCQKVIFIPGNHDFLNEREFTDLSQIGYNGDKIKYLAPNELYIYNDIKFYGFPWIPNLKNWAFYKDDINLYHECQKVPKNVDILISHCPPDVGNVATVDKRHGSKNFGSFILTKLIEDKSPKYFICGHIHSGSKIPYKYNDTTIINVSIKDEDYDFVYNPYIFEI